MGRKSAAAAAEGVRPPRRPPRTSPRPPAPPRQPAKTPQGWRDTNPPPPNPAGSAPLSQAAGRSSSQAVASELRLSRRDGPRARWRGGERAPAPPWIAIDQSFLRLVDGTPRTPPPAGSSARTSFPSRSMLGRLGRLLATRRQFRATATDRRRPKLSGLRAPQAAAPCI